MLDYDFKLVQKAQKQYCLQSTKLINEEIIMIKTDIITRLYKLELIKPYTKLEAFASYEKLGDILKRELKAYKIVLNDRAGFDELITRYNELYLKDECFNENFNMLVRATVFYLKKLKWEENNEESK